MSDVSLDDCDNDGLGDDDGVSDALQEGDDDPEPEELPERDALSEGEGRALGDPDEERLGLRAWDRVRVPVDVGDLVRVELRDLVPVIVGVRD